MGQGAGTGQEKACLLLAYYTSMLYNYGMHTPTTDPITKKPTPAYRRWHGIKQRCLNPNSHIWKYYGGRGVTVCERWLSFQNFHDDMGDPPPGMWIDRIDNDKHYGPDNCRWVTPMESSRNKRRQGGQNPNPNSLRQLAIKADLPYMVVYLRIKTLGWTKEKALSTPKMPRNHKSMVMQQLALERGKIVSVFPKRTFSNLPDSPQPAA